MKTLNYHFDYAQECKMCGEDLRDQKVLGKRLNRSQGKDPKNKIGIATTVVKCRKCDLIFANPMPTPFNILDHYGVPPEAYWKKEYFAEDKDYFKITIEALKKLTEIKPGSKALDIGAGLGKCMIALNNAGFDSYGIEPSEPFHSRAISHMKIDPLKLKLISVEECTFPENEFDFITFGAVLEHLSSPSDAIARAISWLKPGGLIHIEVPSSKWLINKLINLYYRLKRVDYVGNISPMHPPYHLYEFDLKSFQYNAKRNGYSIAHYEYFICETYMPKFLDPILIPYMKWTNSGMQLSIWLKKDA